MTIDDRLREYATRWNAAAPAPPAHTSSAVDDNRTALVISPASGTQQRRARSVLVGAVVVLLVAGAGVTGAALIPRDASAPATTALPDPVTYLAGTVDEPTPAGQLIPTSRRVAAADVGGPLLAGGTWSLTSEIGQVVVVSAWGSWCVPCQQFAPSLGELAQPGVSVVGFAVHEADVATTRKFVASSHITYPVVLDDDGAVIDDLAAPLDQAGVPATFLIDRRGGIAAVYLGVLTRSGIDSAVAALLAE